MTAHNPANTASYRLHRRRLSWFVLVLYWFAVFTLTHLPRVPAVQICGHDLTLHATVFFFLTLFWWLARYGYRRPGLTQRGLWFTLALMATYAAVDELTQGLSFIGRHPSHLDWLADVAGCVLALVLIALLRRPIHWLGAWWLVLFVFTHFADKILLGPSPLTRYQAGLLVAAYAMLTIFWFRWLGRDRFRWSWHWAIGSFLVLAVYALLDEAFALLLGSPFETLDLLAAFFGIALGSACALFFSWQQENPQLGPPDSPQSRSDTCCP
jgi:VanZ family protein